MVDTLAVEGAQGAYVPCLEEATPLPPESGGTIVGSDVGFVPKDVEAAPLPDNPEGAIVGSSVGYVAGVLESVMPVTAITLIEQRDGVEVGRDDRLTGPGEPAPSLFVGQWQITQDGPPNGGEPVHDYEQRVFFRYDVSVDEPDALYYRIHARLQEASPTAPVHWQMWAGDPAWDLGVSIGFTGGYKLAEGVIPAGRVIPNVANTIDFGVTWAADHPRYMWFYFVNASPTGFVVFDESIVLPRGDFVDRFDYNGGIAHFNEGGQTAMFAAPYPFQVTAISDCQ